MVSWVCGLVEEGMEGGYGDGIACMHEVPHWAGFKAHLPSLLELID